MPDAVLCVDDEPGVLAALRRFLDERYAVTTAVGGEAALAVLAERGPFAVVVSDLDMPGMDGARFLAAARERCPDTVRVLLTGQADLGHAIRAVNDGHIFRFLTKPCAPADLRVAAAVREYRLVAAERELLDKTLRGSVQVLAEVFALAAPDEFGRAVRVQQLAGELARVVGWGGGWAVEVAAVMARVGSLVVPDAMLQAERLGGQLTPEDERRLSDIPRVMGNLLRHVPRLEPVTEILAARDRPFVTSGMGVPDGSGADIPPGSRLLRVVVGASGNGDIGSSLRSVQVASVVRDAATQSTARASRARAGPRDRTGADGVRVS